jgi:hypothetical protein
MISPMLLLWIIWLSLPGSAVHAESLANDPRPAFAGASWVQFYVREFPEGRLTYFYDASTVRRRGDILAAHWKVMGSPDPTITFYSVEIECRADRFTETGTVLIDAEGKARDLPASELLADQPIEPGTSSDIFRLTFCR